MAYAIPFRPERARELAEEPERKPRPEFRVEFRPSRRVVSVPAGTTLLAAARSAGLPVASACGAGGICGRCGLRVLEGGDLPPETASEQSAKARNRVDRELRLACRLPIRSDLIVTAPYW
ncbi:MAG: 2Fe-2S iron-sulfur cluster-binding protein [Proteobacteria bacterium]|nr:2Fe-2S iron-sulfur cluster-binding protein [Pseudomonadota bacterium]